MRLHKGTDGSAQFQVISDIAQVIHLAGRRGGFDIKDYGVDKELADSLDRTFTPRGYLSERLSVRIV